MGNYGRYKMVKKMLPMYRMPTVDKLKQVWQNSNCVQTIVPWNIRIIQVPNRLVFLYLTFLFLRCNEFHDQNWQRLGMQSMWLQAHTLEVEHSGTLLGTTLWTGGHAMYILWENFANKNSISKTRCHLQKTCQRKKPKCINVYCVFDVYMMSNLCAL